MSASKEHTETVRRLIGSTDELERVLIDDARTFMDEHEDEPSALADDFAGHLRERVLSGEAISDRALAMDGLLEAVADDVDWEQLSEELLVRATV